MIENSSSEPPEKTMAELEAEARARARLVMKNQMPEQQTPRGQPEVTRFKKAPGHRTLIVSLLSLAILITLAFGGDRLLLALKKSDDNEAGTSTHSSIGTGQHERKNLGMDGNPFGLLGQDKQEKIYDYQQTQPIQLPAESPVLNKAVALADGSSNISQSSHSSDSRRERLNKSDDNRDASTANAAPNSGREVKQGNIDVAKVSGVRRLDLDPNLYIPVDRYIPCSLMRRFISDISGHISCLIGEDVYSASNHVKLIPRGTIARGVYRSGAMQQGRNRMFIVWSELRTPEPGSLKIPLIDADATGPLGEVGISGWIDTHFWERFGNALMLSTVQDVAAAAASSAPGKERNTDYTENSRAAAAEMAKTALENSLDIPPTLYLNQGDIIGIMTGADIDFSSVYRLHINARTYGG